MTSTGKYEIPKCGTCFYSITGPKVPAPASPKPSPLSLGTQQCNAAFDGHDDIQGGLQEGAAEIACGKADEHIIKDGDPSTNIRYVADELGTSDPFVYEVSWIKDCKSTVTEMNAGKPLADDPNVTCASLLKDNYSHCKSDESQSLCDDY